ncbi:hypothetical protein F5H01DRAFT_399389 [Linnemannia elongata]|nr:hypothetical protein F5H01DRAFT_399389 [Linnemannia elongata]
MSQIRLRQLRKWMVFIATLNLLGMLAWYGYLAYYNEQAKKYGDNEATLLWGDWVVIISAIGFFIFYILSLRGSGFQNVHKYVRTFLLLVPTIVVLYLTCNAIHLELQAYSEYASSGYDYGAPFTCGDISNYSCYLQYTNMFMGLISALFVVIEVGVTLAWGPLEKAHRFGGAQGGYIQNANVILVSPDLPYQHQQQQQYYFPQQQQQFQQQQAYYPHMQQLQHPPQQPILIGPNITSPSIPQTPQQKQLPDHPLTYLPYNPSSTHTQSPIAATTTTTAELQPSPLPSPLPSTTVTQPFTPAQ